MRAALPLLAFAAAGVLWSTGASAEPGAVFGAAPLVLQDAELEAERGGIATPTGLNIGFGATVRTFVDGALALESRLTWTDQGLQTVVATGGVETRLVDNAAAAGLSIPQGGAWQGVVLPGDGGETAVLQDIGQDRIASLVVNTANNRDVRQDITVDLEIPQLAQMQADFALQQLQLRLQDALGAALTDAGLK